MRASHNDHSGAARRPKRLTQAGARTAATRAAERCHTRRHRQSDSARRLHKYTGAACTRNARSCCGQFQCAGRRRNCFRCLTDQQEQLSHIPAKGIVWLQVGQSPPVRPFFPSWRSPLRDPPRRPGRRRPLAWWVRWSAVGVLGMSWRGVDQPDGAFVVIDDVADSAAAGYLVLPLFHITAVVPVAGQVAAEAVLAVVVRPGPRVGAQDLQAATGGRQRVAAQLLPAGRRIAGAEPDIPLVVRRRDGDPVTAPGFTR